MTADELERLAATLDRVLDTDWRTEFEVEVSGMIHEEPQ